MRRLPSNMCSVSVTPERLTPSIIDKNLCVSGSSRIVRLPVTYGEKLGDVGAAICERRLRGLRREGMHVAQQQTIERLALLNSAQERGGFDPVAGAGELDVLILWALVGAEQKRKASHAFATIDAHLIALRICARRNDGHDALSRKNACSIGLLAGTTVLLTSSSSGSRCGASSAKSADESNDSSRFETDD